MPTSPGAMTSDHDETFITDLLDCHIAQGRRSSGAGGVLGRQHHHPQPQRNGPWAVVGLPAVQRGLGQPLDGRVEVWDIQNQADIANAIKPFYGTDAGNDLIALLRVHILTAADILTAAKGKGGDLETAIQAWYDNAHDIAVFLHELNPRNWPRRMSKSIFKYLRWLTCSATASLPSSQTSSRNSSG